MLGDEAISGKASVNRLVGVHALHLKLGVCTKHKLMLKYCIIGEDEPLPLPDPLHHPGGRPLHLDNRNTFLYL